RILRSGSAQTLNIVLTTCLRETPGKAGNAGKNRTQQANALARARARAGPPDAWSFGKQGRTRDPPAAPLMGAWLIRGDSSEGVKASFFEDSRPPISCASGMWIAGRTAPAILPKMPVDGASPASSGMRSELPCRGR